MQLQLSFSSLLAGVLVALSFTQDAEAAAIRRRNTGLISLPLQPVARRSDFDEVHPLLYLDQHINRAVRRFALMSGQPIPSDEMLIKRLERRMASLADGDEGVVRRFNRPTSIKSPRSDDVLEARFNPFHPPSTSSSPNVNQLHAEGNANAGVGGSGDPLADAIAALFPNASRKKKKGKKGHGGHGGGAAGNVTQTAGATATASNPAATGSGQSLPIPDGVTVSDDPNADNSIALDIEGQDVGYLATVQIGTPPRDFLILMDSGSADFWVGGEACTTIGSNADCGNHNFLGTQSSSSFQDSGKNFEVVYGSGQVAGTVVQDDVVLAGLSLKSHTFGAASQESDDFSSDQTSFDGLMGLAQSTLSKQKTLTPPEALAQQGLIQDAIVSYKIPRLADGLKDGVITFGGLDESKFDAQTLVTLDNINTEGFWEADVDAASVDGQDSGLQQRTAILDTGTSLILVPPQDAVAIHQLIQGAGQDAQNGFTVPCDTTASVAITFGGTEFQIDPRDLAFAELGNGDCVSGIQGVQTGPATQWLVGDVFLKNAYFSHDVTKNTMSLAKLV